jgi:hypothetical protein
VEVLMKKYFLLFLLPLLLLFNCSKTETTKSFLITVEDSIFARADAEGNLSRVDSAVFKRGEAVNLVLLNVGKFKKGEDGKHWFDIDMEVIDPKGNVILSRQGLLGENGHILLPNDTAESPYGIFSTTEQIEPGIYKMKLTIYDKIGKGKATVTKSFTLE